MRKRFSALLSGPVLAVLIGSAVGCSSQAGPTAPAPSPETEAAMEQYKKSYREQEKADAAAEAAEAAKNK